MEEDINFLERRIKLNSQMYLEFGRLLSLDEETTTAIKNLINKYKEQKRDIQASHILLAKYSQKIEEQEKIIELIANDLYELYKQYPGIIDKFYKHKICLFNDCDDINREVNCDYCFKEYYKKKARDENE